MNIDSLIVLAIALIAAATVLWFFRIRRLMIMRQRSIVEILEEELKPRDKTYTLLGYLVGFKADYLLDNRVASKAWILYIMPPHHVLLYLPVIHLLGRRERIALSFKLKTTPLYDAHVVDLSDTWALRSFRIDYGEHRLKYCGSISSLHDKLVGCGSPYGLNLLVDLIRNCSTYGVRVVRASIDRDKSIMHVQAVIEGADVRPFIKELKRLLVRLVSKT